MMKKLGYVLLAATILAGCNTSEDTSAPASTHAHSHEGERYDNPQHMLQENLGEQALTFPPLLTPTSTDGNQIVYELTAQQGNMTFVDGVETATYGYNGNFLGPVLRLEQGQEVTIKLTNDLPEPTTFHWHGLEVAGDARDGGPHAVIEPGVTETIQFTVNQQAATLWYHPHPMGYTAKQVYKGLAGLLYIEDATSKSLHLPNDYAINDFPIILQDRTLLDGELVYEEVANTMSTLGDTVMINGVVNPALTAPKEKVRLRILNGSNALTYYLKFENDMPFQLLATDGGFLQEASELTKLTLGAGERVEILVDLTQVEGNTLALLNNDTVLMPINITGDAKEIQYDKELTTFDVPDEIAQQEPTKSITMEGMTENFLLNGQSFDPDRIDLRQKQGVTEIWEIENIITDEGAMAHPFHIHGTQFLVISVNGKTPDASMQGYKDTITVQPMDKVRIAVRFPEKGIYMFHCHILEHEDVGMMGQIEIY
ncbi:multicopper oxidase domain-containing protein [Solibacillus sp. FSL H8-0523]|uniref:multicopper oxidase family protein n=1 Tax=Solibacillus sp. FSL H8-0523 TaxID=2954511 RepID=UPI003100AAAB